MLAFIQHNRVKLYFNNISLFCCALSHINTATAMKCHCGCSAFWINFSVNKFCHYLLLMGIFDGKNPILNTV